MTAARAIQDKTIKFGPGTSRGYCNPHDVQWPGSLDFYTNTCQRTKLVVIVRHPVLWFESFYNYRRIRGEDWSVKGDGPNDLITRGNNKKGNYVNSSSGAFHKWLAVLGKTSLNKHEMDLLNGWYNHTDEFRNRTKTIVNGVSQNANMTRVENPMFIMDISQLAEKNTTLKQQLNHDLQMFLELSGPLPAELPHSNSGASRLKHNKKREALMMNICDEEMEPIHNEMLLVARNASSWMNQYFLNSPDVSYSGNLRDIIEGWKIDPCIARTIKNEEGQKDGNK